MNRAAKVMVTLFECYALAELVFYATHNGEQRLYEIAAAKLAEVRTHLIYRAQVLATLRMIRRLPEE